MAQFHKRRVHAVDMTQKVVADMAQFLRRDFPTMLEKSRPFEYHLHVHIRDGVVQLLNVETKIQDRDTCTLADGEDYAQLIRAVEKWLIRRLPSTLVHGFHGKVCVVVGMKEGGVLKFDQSVGQQTKYAWHRVLEVSTR